MLCSHYKDANPNLPPKAPPPDAITVGVRMSTYKFGFVPGAASISAGTSPP